MRALLDDVARVLPVEDDAIASLDARTRREVARAWQERARSELATAGAFAEVTRILVTLDAALELAHRAAAATADEIRHAAICSAVACAYDAEARPLPARERGDAGDALLFVVAQACIQETLGAAFLRASLDRTTAPTARAATRALLEDDVEHGRLGWAFLASLRRRDRERVERALPELLAACRARWAERARELVVSIPEHGVSSGAEVLEVIDDALERLVRPGLAELGLPLR